MAQSSKTTEMDGRWPAFWLTFRNKRSESCRKSSTFKRASDCAEHAKQVHFEKLVYSEIGNTKTALTVFVDCVQEFFAFKFPFIPELLRKRVLLEWLFTIRGAAEPVTFQNAPAHCMRRSILQSTEIKPWRSLCTGPASHQQTCSRSRYFHWHFGAFIAPSGIRNNSLAKLNSILQKRENQMCKGAMCKASEGCLLWGE